MFKSWMLFPQFWRAMHALLCQSKAFTRMWWLLLFFFSASAKAAPLNINKVSNSLLNFGRKLIAPAMASGGAAGAPASGSSFPPPAVPIRSTVETPQHHHHQHHHHHQAQQQRMMKSESMPVQLGKGKGDMCGTALTEGSFVIHLNGLKKVLFLILGWWVHT